MSNKDRNSPSESRSRLRSRSRQPSIERISRTRSRSPISPPRYYSSRPRIPLDDPARLNPVRNQVLAVFGLDHNAKDKHLYFLYKKFGCELCKVIYDKAVS